MKALVVVSVLLALVAIQPGAAQESVRPVAQTGPTDGARQILDLINAERSKSALSPLAWDSRLAAAAQRHTELQLQRQQISHQFRGEPPLKKRLSDVPLDRSGENVGVDTSVEGAHRAFMQSPGHRENILEPAYNAVGIAVLRDRGEYWVTEDFAHVFSELSESEAVKQAAEAFAQARARSRQPQLLFRSDSRLQSMACRMAKKDKINSRPALEVPGAAYVAAYTSMDPAVLPDGVLSLLKLRDVNSYSVGACFARTPHYPSGAYWMLMVMFNN